MIEQKFVEVLLADSAVTALVEDRIFPVVIRQEAALPALTYQRLSGERTYTMSGRGGWATVRIGVSCWASEYAQARALAEAVRVALDAYVSDEAGDIQIASVVDGADSFVEEIGAFGCSLDVTAQYMEA